MINNDKSTIKTATITMHASHNCGSMIQSYALQQIILSLGYKNVIINFRSNEQKNMYALFRKPNNLHNLFYDIVKLLYYKYFRQHYDDYECFIKNFLQVTSKEYKTLVEMNSLEKNYDVFIAGSDQIWNIRCDDANDAYFLCFIKGKRKIAYAPSFGVTNINNICEKVNIYKEYLSHFSELSIRENNGAKWIKEMIGKDIPILLDPSMLLSKNEYQKIIGTSVYANQKYIFYYAFTYSEKNNAIVAHVSKIMEMPVIILDVKSWIKNCRKHGFILSKHGGPIAFLDLLFNADLVFTTSFHGSALSIIGEKKFWFIDSVIHDEDDDRVWTLLHGLGLENRMRDGSFFNNINNILEPLDFQAANKKLELLREKSINYLKKSIN